MIEQRMPRHRHNRIGTEEICCREGGKFRPTSGFPSVALISIRDAVQMPPHQVALASFELVALFAGAVLLWRTLASSERRTALFSRPRLEHWNVNGPEVALLLILIFFLGAAGQNAVAKLLGNQILRSPDRAGLEVAAYGFGFHAVALLGWPVFALLLRRVHPQADAFPASASATGGAPSSKIAVAGITAVLMALPLLTLTSLGWGAALHWFGLPEEPQDLIAIFGQTKSPSVTFAMFFVACVVAPINEELIFRAAIFRYLRQRFSRGFAFGVSSVCFAALHANWASFLPLAVFGVVLALTYERTGDIRASIVAHGLFNLNTILYILSGLPQ
jgi:membrane protease YdiL (CAAX protease family)